MEQITLSKTKSNRHIEERGITERDLASENCQELSHNI